MPAASARSVLLLGTLLAGGSLSACGLLGGSSKTAARTPGASAEDAAAPAQAQCWNPNEDWRGVVEPPRTDADRLMKAAITNELERLHRAVGLYGRGERPIYTGRLAAQDNFGQNGGATRDGSFRGDVWAVLLTDTARAGRAPAEGLPLVIVNEAAERKVWVYQKTKDPEVTSISPVTDWTTNAGSLGQCRGCVVPIASAPDAIGFTELVATQPFARFEGKVTLDGRLVRVPPARITLAQVTRAHHFDPNGEEAAMKELSPPTDGEVRRRVHGKASIPADDARSRAPAGHTDCTRTAEYDAEQWIDVTCLGRYGVRAVSFGPTKTRCCVPYQGHDQPPPCVDVP